MKFAHLILYFFLWITGTHGAHGQVSKIVVPESTGYGYRHLQYNPPGVPGHTHFGVDIMGACGKLIYPLSSGSVVAVKKNEDGLGNAVMIRHSGMGRNGGDLYTIYLHMQTSPNINGKVLVVGDIVYGGVPIGKIGDTGFADGCHTHFEIRNFYFSSIADGWYHQNSKRCSDSSLNIYACGDQRSDSWALSGWENPETYQIKQNLCDPTKQRCTLRINGPIGWFPPVNDCQQASQWFNMAIVNGEKIAVGSAQKSSCPIACYAN